MFACLQQLETTQLIILFLQVINGQTCTEGVFAFIIRRDAMFLNLAREKRSCIGLKQF